MLACFLVIFLSLTKAFANNSPNYFCAEMNPQRHVNIEQLMGMWYGMELLSHMEEGHYERVMPSCPILYISEDKNYETTYNPLYKNYDYGYNYGERRDQQHQRLDRNQNRRIHHQQQYTTQSPYNSGDRNYNYNNRRYGTSDNNNRKQYQDDWKRLSIWWDENGSATEYHLRYNVTRPGFWLSSGPQNGSQLEPQFSHFAGTVQVIKAVGSHMALTFCHQLPDRQLFTILLSRETKLDFADIHNVHSLLNNRGLSTTAIKKVCSNGSVNLRFTLKWMIVIIVSLLA